MPDACSPKPCQITQLPVLQDMHHSMSNVYLEISGLILLRLDGAFQHALRPEALWSLIRVGFMPAAGSTGPPKADVARVGLVAGYTGLCDNEEGSCTVCRIGPPKLR